MNETTSTSRLVEIFALSATVLFLELSLIRWLPANVYSLAFFTNIVLIGAFYGFGMGILLSPRKSLLPVWSLYLLAFVGFVILLRDIDVLIPAGSSEWVWSRYQGDQLTRGAWNVPLELTLVVLFFATAFVFVPLGQRIARLMSGMDSLRFYSFDLLGSIAGIALFTVGSALGTPPWVWFSAVALLASVAILKAPKGRPFVSLLLLLGCVGAVFWAGQGERWSPYYSLRTTTDGHQVKVFVNRLYHQEAIDLDHVEIPGYQLPYRFFEGGRVLVVGAGTGNDVAVALRNGAASVDAVEIDPGILRLGQQHPLRPYEDERVTTIVSDARTFLENTTATYDLIVFGTLDSHALLSSVSTIRLDNYVYTRESLEAARKRLASDGLLAMLYSVPSENGEPRAWIADRLIGMAQRVFGTDRVLISRTTSEFLNLILVARNEGAWPGELARHTGPEISEDVELPTDDWPFLYLEGRTIPAHYVVVVAAVLLIGSLLIFLVLPKAQRAPEWNFLFLGAGFLLLETSGVTRLSLLFGSTWIVNSVVFGAILCVVLAANVLIARMKGFPVHWVYSLLLASLVASYVFPVSALLSSSSILKVGGAVILVGLPVFFAGLAFSNLFRATKNVQHAFGSNLLGAFLGGFLEYASMIIGLRDLLLLAICLYLSSYLLTLRRG